TITHDEKKKTLTIEDNGLGMTRDELINNIGTVAKSGTLSFLEEMKKTGKAMDESLIGQFGVGFYSVFMVTEEVTIETRYAAKDSHGYKWVSSGEGMYTIEETKKEKRGTRISFTLKKDAEEFAEEFRIKNIIEKYSNFADFPIYLGKNKINSVDALWRKDTKQITDEELTEFYKFVSHDYEKPLGHLQLSLEGAAVSFKALLFVPHMAPFDLYRNPEPKTVNLYTNKILIQNDCKHLLPDYLRFVRGVVDTADLPLNVSREVTQNSPVMAKIKNILVSKLLALFADWAKTDTEKYTRFYSQFGRMFSTGMNSDFSNREKIMELLRFESTATKEGDYRSLAEYANNMRSEQKEIYYLSGENRESIERNPNLEYFKKNNIEVFLLTDPIDIFVFPGIGEYEKKK
ncbi:MAG: molecular chaperone HtpG, partial [Candidatus Moranbacteria bacterium]|nr:molecular chaperone HtpG [Candidatus Moranbacteria bacterium]